MRNSSNFPDAYASKAEIPKDPEKFNVCGNAWSSGATEDATETHIGISGELEILKVLKILETLRSLVLEGQYFPRMKLARIQLLIK